MKKIIFISLLSLAFSMAKSQQDPLLSQYMFNGLLINPAYAGSKPYLCTTLLHRSQWTGWKGAPMTDVITVHGLLRDKRSGLGVMLSNDRAGVTNRTDLYVNYAFHIPVNNRMKLALGLKGGVSMYNAQLQNLTYWDANDLIYSEGSRTDVLPNFGAGAFLYDRKFYAGFSIPTLISNDPADIFSIANGIPSLTKVRRHYLLTAGYAYELNPAVVIRPSFVLRYVKSAKPTADLNLNVLLVKKFWIGASYRTGDAIVGIFEFQVSPRFRLGYAYDFTLSKMGNYSSGSHEFMLGYDLGYDILKMRTPRYF